MNIYSAGGDEPICKFAIIPDLPFAEQLISEIERPLIAFVLDWNCRWRKDRDRPLPTISLASHRDPIRVMFIEDRGRKQNSTIITSANNFFTYGSSNITINFQCRGDVMIHSFGSLIHVINLHKFATCKIIGVRTVAIDGICHYLAGDKSYYLYNCSWGTHPSYLLWKQHQFKTSYPSVLYQSTFRSPIFINRRWGINCAEISRDSARIYIFDYLRHHRHRRIYSHPDR